ncbi:hypothetical protein F8M41_018366 [Gigaspora margarita]|uniref:Uncharacterized protein n=1 Tax=Gigaspora margarita TaxID=4874 RepID=A0A8H4ALM9_GIGMA|nr:hypothetical protein F8M41_018366 [Gigaspora margarita]
MYFGPGQEVTYKSEYWHSNLWSESPLYGQESITINNVLANEILKLKIQKIIKFGELPKNIQSSNHQVSSQSGEVWLVDQVINNLVNKHEVVEHVSVTILSNNKEQYSYYINEIIYKFKGHWKIRNILLKYQHPSEYATVSLPPSENIPVFKLFLDLYYDNFGTYRNVYHSLGSVYIQFGNMLISLRQQLRNHFVLGFVPFGGSFNEFIRPFIIEIKFLESGQLMNIQGQEYWVITSLGVVIADLPQGNNLAGFKRHSANKEYQTCQVSKEHFTNNDLDFKNLSRYQHITNSQFHEIALFKSIQEHKLVATKYGLCNNIPILSQLIWDQHLQTPQDIYHATAGKIMRLLKLTAWHIKSTELTNIQQRINANCTDLVSKSLIKYWVLVAKSAQLVFKKSYSTDDYKNLQKCLETESQILTQIFAEFENLPNLHINNHLPLYAHIYGNLVNTSVGTKEMHLIDSGVDIRISKSNQGFVNISQDFKKLFSDWFITKTNNFIQLDQDIDIEGVTYLVENSCNIIEKYSLHIGDIITIQEEEKESYAILRAIFHHKGNNGYFYLFIVINWLEKTNQVHSLLECPIYKIQLEKNRNWRRVYPLSVVDQIKKAHFGHRCSSEYTISYDLENMYYLKMFIILLLFN